MRSTCGVRQLRRGVGTAGAPSQLCRQRPHLRRPRRGRNPGDCHRRQSVRLPHQPLYLPVPATLYPRTGPDPLGRQRLQLGDPPPSGRPGGPLIRRLQPHRDGPAQSGDRRSGRRRPQRNPLCLLRRADACLLAGPDRAREWPYRVTNPAEGFLRFAPEPSVADLDNDRKAEVIFTTWTQKGSNAPGSWSS